MHGKRSGRPSIITDDLVELVREHFMENRRFTITELSSHLPLEFLLLVAQHCHGEPVVLKIVRQGVLKQLTQEDKAKRMESTLTFLLRYYDDVYAFLDQVITRARISMQMHVFIKTGYTSQTLQIYVS